MGLKEILAMKNNAQVDRRSRLENSLNLQNLYYSDRRGEQMQNALDRFALGQNVVRSLPPQRKLVTYTYIHFTSFCAQQHTTKCYGGVVLQLQRQ